MIGSLTKRNVGDASKFRHPIGADKPESYYTYSLLLILFSPFLIPHDEFYLKQGQKHKA